MQFPKFKYEDALWDKFRRLHNGHLITHAWNMSNAPLITFETQEAIWQAVDMKPDLRVKHRDLNIEVISTAADKQPRYRTPAGEPVKLAWLNHKGQQQLIIDYDFMIAVRYDGSRFPDTPSIPQWVRNRAYVYWPGPDFAPIGVPIEIARPYVPSEEEVENVKEKHAACRMWHDIQDPEEMKKIKHTNDTAVSFSTVRDTPLDLIGNDMRLRIVRKGILKDIVKSYVPHLIVE